MAHDPENDLLWAMPVPLREMRTAVNPPSLAHGAMATGIATTVIAFVSVVVRIFTRGVVVKGLGIDDALVVISIILALIFAGIALKSLELGAGNHMWDIPVEDFNLSMLYQFILTISYSTAVSFSKLLILTLYLRLSPERMFRTSVYALISIVVAYTMAYQFYIIFQCHPVVLPLKIPTRRKISLIILFATGGFVCAATIQRTIILPDLLKATDYTWEVPPQMIWGFIEINAGLVCTSVPALKAFFMRYLPFILTSRLLSSSSQPRSNSHRVRYSNTHDMSKSRSRSRKAMQSFELPSRDNLPAPHTNDDEAKLWGVVTTTTKKKDSSVDANSFESFEEQYVGSLERSAVIERGEVGGSHTRTGINVVTETRVSYATRQ